MEKWGKGVLERGVGGGKGRGKKERSEEDGEERTEKRAVQSTGVRVVGIGRDTSCWPLAFGWAEEQRPRLLPLLPIGLSLSFAYSFTRLN